MCCWVRVFSDLADWFHWVFRSLFIGLIRMWGIFTLYLYGDLTTSVMRFRVIRWNLRKDWIWRVFCLIVMFFLTFLVKIIRCCPWWSWLWNEWETQVNCGCCLKHFWCFWFKRDIYCRKQQLIVILRTLLWMDCIWAEEVVVFSRQEWGIVFYFIEIVFGIFLIERRELLIDFIINKLLAF